MAGRVQIYRSWHGFTLRARKGPASVSHYPGGLFQHPFPDGGGKVLGNPDGSITLMPRRGRRLWGFFPAAAAPAGADGRAAQEPFLGNPYLAVLNPRTDPIRAFGERVARGSRRGASSPRSAEIPRGPQGDMKMAKHKKGHRARRNPFGIPGLGAVKSDAMDAVAVAGGLLAVPLATGLIPLPAAMQTGPLRYIPKIGVALLAGWASSKVFGSRAGRMVGVGALAAIAVEGGNELATRAGLLPGAAPAALALGYDRNEPPIPGVGSYTGMGSYTGFGRDYAYAGAY